MRDQLSSNKDRSIDENKSLFICQSLDKKERVGTESEAESSNYK